MANNFSDRNSDLQRLVDKIEERLQQSQLPADKILFDNWDAMRFMKISKRKLAQLRADRLIRYHPTGLSAKKNGTGRRSGKIYYSLQDIIDFIKSATVNPISQTKRL